jgi:hypothetical protein
LHGGEPARRWSESIVRAYIPKEVKNWYFQKLDV